MAKIINTLDFFAEPGVVAFRLFCAVSGGRGIVIALASLTSSASHLLRLSVKPFKKLNGIKSKVCADT